MSDLVFNDEVSAPWGFPMARRQMHKNTEVRSVAGTRQSLQNSDQDQMVYMLNFINITNSEKADFMDFFEDRDGSHDTFLFYDERTYQVTDENIGTGDGSTATFQLTQNGFDRWNIVGGSYTIKVDGTSQTHGTAYTLALTDDGRTIFQAGYIPGAAAAITATYQYYRRVHFGNEILDILETNYQVWQIADVILEEILVQP